jgi:hypothetical protein
MDRVLAVTDFRPFLQFMFPGIEDDRDDNDPFEHPMTAVGLVLMSAATIGAAELTSLVLFTGYSRPFISAITFNLQNNQLWIDALYDASTWLTPDGNIDAEGLWTHIELACGNLWVPEANPEILADPCGIYWDERGGFNMGNESKTVPDVH